MALIYHELNIPLDTDSTFDYIVIKQGDAGSHKVRATLINNNSVFTIPTSNATYYFKFRKPDNTYVLVQATVSNNQIIADVTEEMLRVAGTGRGEFMIVQGSTELKTATFYFKIVQQTYTTDDVISSSNFATFASLLAGAGNAASNANAAAAAANTAAANAEAKADLIPDDYTALVQQVEDIQEELENLDVETDATLTEQGKPADAKATGDKIAELNGSLAHISLSDEVKVALLNCFRHTAWVDNDGPNCYASLYEALYPNTSLDHITAVFTQGSFVVEPETPLNALKPYLTVTGHYKDGASIAITGYTLSGTLTAGTSTVTVTKDGKTATFNVTVTNNSALIYKLPSGTDISNRAIDTNVPVFGANEDFTILIKAHMNALPNDNNTKYLLNHGYLATGTLRLGAIYNANYKTLTFIANVMYQDNVQISITGNEYACDVMYVVRMSNKRVTKKFYIDSTCHIDKDEDISSYISDKVFTGDYMISAFANTTETNGFFPGVVNLLAIYNSALTDDKIESIMGIEI